jgi:hypothetical protein
MARLACPHCSKPVKANPIGRWYSRFSCPHCQGALQFDAITNAIGLGGSTLFFVMMWALVMGASPTANQLAIAAGVVCVLAIVVSYLLRRIVKA